MKHLYVSTPVNTFHMIMYVVFHMIMYLVLIIYLLYVVLY